MGLGVLYALLWMGGSIAAWRLEPLVALDPHALSLHAAGLLVPFLGAMAFTAGAVVAGPLTARRALAALALFALLALPFAGVWRSPIVNLPGDDSYRYSVYAHHMLEAHTLWGSDGLLWGGVRYFVDQPGYRYYLAAAIALLGGENRGLQLFNMGVLLVATLVLLRRLQPRLPRRRFLLLTAFVVAAAPYAGKNVLYGYTEWFTVTLALLAAAEYAAGRLLGAMILLALLPFVRQNLLLVSPLLALALVATTRRWRLLVPYLVVLALPLYLNLYYAGAFRFLAAHRGKPPALDDGVGVAVWNVLEAIAARLPHYVGYAFQQKWTTMAVAALFAPYGTALAVVWVAKAAGRTRWLFAVLAAATIAPTLIMGSGSFPRFEYVNLTVILLAMASVHAEAQRSPARTASNSGATARGA